MDKPILIGLNGKKGSGKNTVAEFIRDWAEENGNEAQLQGFADRLKLSFARIFVPDCTLEEALIFCNTLKEHGNIKHDSIWPGEIFHRFGARNSITGREALQNYGTEGHRDIFGYNFWIDQLLPNPGWRLKWTQDVDFALVTDVRFTDEADRIRELGGEVWEVARPTKKDDGDTHATEQKLSDDVIDERIINDEGLDELKGLVYKLMDYTHGKHDSDKLTGINYS